ncbi:MAG: hypothetical protein DRN96_04190 [Thermoproteota archaeon]|nr:MAG: hypothetical protein DRN99_09665 [Candidatus Korarchaeota archaeon]RLG51872.1 MAG: hypothetical protein DRN96_04190 [Candidatus Korarchaeota archaeon]
MARLDIALLHPRLDLYGGSQKLVLQLAEGLSAHHQVTVYTTRYSVEKWGAPEFSVIEVQPAARLLRMPLYPLAAKLLAASMGDHDVYNLHGFPSHLASKHPSVWYCHEPPRELYDLSHEYAAQLPAPRPVSQAALWALRAYDRKKALQVDAIASNSAYTRRYIRLAYGIEAPVVYPGVKLSSYRPRSPDAPVLLTVARLVKHKRVDLVVKAMKLIAKRIPDAKLIIVGEGPEKLRLLSLARSLGVERRVELLGEVGEGELIDLYSQAYCLIYTPEREPFGLAVLEAMASSKPAIVSAEGGLLELVEDRVTGYLVSRSPREIAEKAILLLKSRSKAEQMGRAALAKARRYSISYTVESLSSLLERASSASSASS